MFEFLKRLFGRKKAEEETVMEENKVELTPIGADEEIKDIEMPASRYTEEYAEFVESQIPEQPQKSLAEEMIEDPFADVKNPLPNRCRRIPSQIFPLNTKKSNEHENAAPVHPERHSFMRFFILL